MTATEILEQLDQLKQSYEQDCAALHLALYGKPWLLGPRLQERGEKYDEDRMALLAQAPQFIADCVV